MKEKETQNENFCDGEKGEELKENAFWFARLPKEGEDVATMRHSP